MSPWAVVVSTQMPPALGVGLEKEEVLGRERWVALVVGGKCTKASVPRASFDSCDLPPPPPPIYTCQNKNEFAIFVSCVETWICITLHKILVEQHLG